MRWILSEDKKQDALFLIQKSQKPNRRAQTCVWLLSIYERKGKRSLHYWTEEVKSLCKVRNADDTCICMNTQPEGKLTKDASFSVADFPREG